MTSKTVNGTLNKMIVLVIVVIAAAVAYQLYKAAQQGGKAAGKLLGEQIVYKQTGIEPARQKYIRSLAQQIRNAVTIVPMLDVIVWVSDSDVITALNQLQTAAEVSLVSDYFTELSGKQLGTDIVNNSGFFTSSSRAKIKSLVLQNLV